MSYKSYQYVIPAGEQVEFNISGEGIAILQSNLPIFEMCFDAGVFTDMERGLEYRPVGGFSGFCIRNPNSIGLEVRFGVFSGDFSDRRFLTNEVQGINPSTYDDVTSQGFTVFGGTVGLTALQYGCVQFTNPVGSGKIVVFDRFDVALAAAAVLRIGQYNTDIGGGVDENSLSVLVGGGVGVLEMRQENAITGILGGGAQPIWRSQVAANQTFPIEFKRPIFLTAGNSIIVQPQVAQVEMSVNAQFLEIDG